MITPNCCGGSQRCITNCKYSLFWVNEDLLIGRVPISLALALPPAQEAAYAMALAQTPFTIPKHPFDPKKQYTRDKPKSISQPSANILEMIEFYWRHHTIDEGYATAQYQAWLAGKDPLPNPQQGTSSSGSEGTRGYRGRTIG